MPTTKITLLSIACAIALAACEKGTPTTPVRVATTGSIALSVIVAGNSNDADGFLVQVAGKSLPIVSGQSVVVDSLAPSRYTALISGIADNCFAAADTAGATVTAGARANMQFSVTCYGGFAYQEQARINYLDASGRTVQVENDAPMAFVNSISPDGTRLVYSGEANGGLGIAKLDGTGSTVITSSPPNMLAAGDAYWSPDGQSIAYYRDFASGAITSALVRIVKPDGTGDHAVANQSVEACCQNPTWSPDGTRLAVAVELPDSSGRPALGTIKSDGTGLAIFPATIGISPGTMAWSPDGTMIGFTENQLLHVLVVATGQMLSYGGVIFAPLCSANCHWDWSPDSRHLVAAFSSHQTGLVEITTLNVDGTGVTPLAQGVGPRWSPDGKKILFMRINNDYPGPGLETHIFIMNPDGTGLHALTGGAGRYLTAPMWSPTARPGANP